MSIQRTKAEKHQEISAALMVLREGRRSHRAHTQYRGYYGYTLNFGVEKRSTSLQNDLFEHNKSISVSRRRKKLSTSLQNNLFEHVCSCGHYAVTTVTTRKLRSLRGHYAVTTVTMQSLRGHT